MGFLAPLLGGLASSVIGGIISGNSQKAAAAQAAQEQQNLQDQAFNNQVNFYNQQTGQERNAISGLTQGGNPYLNALTSLPPPSYAPGGSFGPSPTSAGTAPNTGGMPQFNSPLAAFVGSGVQGASPMGDFASLLAPVLAGQGGGTQAVSPNFLSQAMGGNPPAATSGAPMAANGGTLRFPTGGAQGAPALRGAF